jgi:hypothetical protein
VAGRQDIPQSCGLAQRTPLVILSRGKLPLLRECPAVLEGDEHSIWSNNLLRTCAVVDGRRSLRSWTCVFATRIHSLTRCRLRVRLYELGRQTLTIITISLIYWTCALVDGRRPLRSWARVFASRIRFVLQSTQTDCQRSYTEFVD